MIATIPWTAVTLGFTTLACLAIGVVVLRTMLARSAPRSEEERRERAQLPATPLHKAARWGLLLGAIQAAVIVGLFLAKGGAAVYWDDAAMRMLFLGLFLLVVFTFTGVRLVIHSRADERDRPVLSWASVTQTTVVFVSLAAWLTILPKMFHEEGAVPIVYCYLIFGSTLMVHMLSYPLGILIGCWGVKHHAQG